MVFADDGISPIPKKRLGETSFKMVEAIEKQLFRKLPCRRDYILPAPIISG
jgi:hypothetical protein